jgi:predicted nicotinamide N-methyase
MALSPVKLRAGALRGACQTGRMRLTREPSPLEIVRSGTALRPVPLVPGILLYQASEPVGLWEHVEEVTGRTETDPPFWAFAWAGGQALARYLLDHPETVRGRRVIDLASGSGLVAIAAAQAGAARVTAYDIDPLAVAAITANAEANGVPVSAVQADILDEAPDADLVLVADAFYQRELAARMARFLDRGQARGIAFLVGDLGRAYLPRDRLAPVATYDVTGLVALEDRDVRRTTVWTRGYAGLRRRAGQPGQGRVGTVDRHAEGGGAAGAHRAVIALVDGGDLRA